jgi:ATP-dependent RNA helicase RhlE
MLLDKSGIKTAAIHGDKSSRQRLRALERFKAGA